MHERPASSRSPRPSGPPRLRSDIYERNARPADRQPARPRGPASLADDAPFPEPTALFILPDHYILRMLYSRGVSMASNSASRGRGTDRTHRRDPRRIWKTFAANYTSFAARRRRRGSTTSSATIFRSPLSVSIAASALRIYDEIAEKLASPEFRPRALFDRFRIEVLATTDAASDSLRAPRLIRASGWRAGSSLHSGRMPCSRSRRQAGRTEIGAAE